MQFSIFALQTLRAVTSIEHIWSTCRISTFFIHGQSDTTSFVLHCLVNMPPKLKRDRSEVEHEEEEEVSNKDLLRAISNLTERMTGIENKITQAVDEKIAGMEKNILEEVTIYKQSTDNRVQSIEKRMEDFIQQVASDMNVARDENCKIIEEKIHHSVAMGSSSATGGISESRIAQLERQVRMNELVVSGVPFLEN